MVKWESKKVGDLLLLAIGLALAVLLNQMASIYFFRIDLTEEKRYSLKPSTRELLSRLDDDVYVEVYLEGDLNAGFRRLRKGTREVLEEFRVYSKNKVHYTFTDPATAKGRQAQQEFMGALAAKGIQPMNVIDNQGGKRTEKLVFPGALISYAGAETGVMLLRDKWSQNAQEKLNQSVEGVEYELASGIMRLSRESPPRIGIVTGHGELDSLHMASLLQELKENYLVSRVNLSQRAAIPAEDVLIVAKPTRLFSEQDKFKLDQYLLKGGCMLMLIDELEATPDSASRENYFAFPYKIGLEDMLFRYGVRINPDLIQDKVAIKYPVVTNVVEGKPQITPIDWPFFPLINNYAQHPITQNLDASFFRFASSLDTVKATGILKTPLLATSPYARKISAPVKVNINDVRKEMTPEKFSEGPINIAYLLEGKFPSLFKNRFKPDGVDTSGYMASGKPSKLIIVGDGDLARNDINPRTGKVQPLGLDNFSGYTFGNRDLLMNMIAFLAEENGLINARSKEVRIRPLDKEKIAEGKGKWQFINVAAPVLLIVVGGIFKAYRRRKKYTGFTN